MQKKLSQIKKNRYLQKIWRQELDAFLKEIFQLSSKDFINKIFSNEKVALSFPLIFKLGYYTFLKKRGCPWEYIFQKVSFLEDTFFVNKNVLIPRSETEELVHLLIQKYQNVKDKIRILDIGSGSGVIAVSLQKAIPQADVVAIDISSKAIQVAQKNAQKILYSTNQKIEFHANNVFCEKINQQFKQNPFDLIVTNPPYVGLKEMKFMSKASLNYEPREALFAGREGLDFFKQLKNRIYYWLKPQGEFYTEMGFKQSQAIKEIFTTLQNPLVLKDLQGKERFFIGKK